MMTALGGAALLFPVGSRSNLLCGVGARLTNPQLMAALSPATERIVGQQAANSNESVLERRGTFAGNQPLK
jgi:hypothetical protein